MKADRDIFGPRLRRERERRGISLKEIAESTKIKESLFAELERGDFSKWPQGIFRRAHLCAYLSAIGLPPQPILADFLRLFPEENPVEQPDQLKATDATELPHVSRVMVVPPSRTQDLAERMWVASFDLAAICLMSSMLAAIAGLNLWPAFALAGLAYAVLGGACFGKSVGTSVQQRIRDAARQRDVAEPVLAPLREVARHVQKDVPEATDAEQHPEVQQQRASA